MPKKKKETFSMADIEALMERANTVLKTGKAIQKKKQRETVKCSNGDGKIVYRQGLCKECYEEKAKLNSKVQPGRRWFSTNGYEYVYDENRKPKLYHRYRMEQLLGRPLTKDEVVTHLDGNKANNEDSNLALATKNGTIVCPHCNKPYYIPIPDKNC